MQASTNLKDILKKLEDVHAILNLLQKKEGVEWKRQKRNGAVLLM